jgi:hypothetical protein
MEGGPDDQQSDNARESSMLPLPVALAPLQPLVKRIIRLLPWASLASGIVGALMMDRGPESARLVAVSAIGVWIVLLAMRYFARFDRHSMAGVQKLMVKGLQLSLLVASQSLMQLTLFFALPSFFLAASFDLGHLVFLLILSVLSAASLWDPLSERMLGHPLMASAFAAFGSFVALIVVLPALGLSTQLSLWLAVSMASVFFPLLVGISVTPEQRVRATATASALALLFPVVLHLGAVRIIPAAPLRLLHAEIGTHLAGKWVAGAATTLDHVPERLFCATAIASPLGLHDRLFHVWRVDGKRRGRVELKIVGGRKQGYRTHSRIKPSGAGKYSCTVETATGQALGSRSIRITAR